MQQKLKSLLRKSSTRKKDQQTQHAKHDSGTATYDGPQSNTARIRNRVSLALSSRDSMSNDSPRPLTVRNEPPVAATDYGPPSPEEIDQSVVDDYKAYMPAISTEDDVSRESQYMSLGGDSRHITGTSEMKHSEDIADRNIDMYGSSRRESYLDPREEHAVDGMLRERHRKASVMSYTSTGSGWPQAPSVTGSKYALGTGIPTEGGLVDSILPHKESTQNNKTDRKDKPVRVPRDDLLWRRSSRTQSKDNNNEKTPTPRGEPLHESLLDERPGRNNDDVMNRWASVMDGPMDFETPRSDKSLGLDGIIDISNTVDVDKSTQVAPAVVHEVIKPHQHEIIEERIYREIHNHDVYHRIQPVYQTVILPARHFVLDAKGNLVEVAEDQIPECTGEFQSWYFGKRESPAVQAAKRLPPLKQPKVIKDIKYMTEEGFERRETTIVHPPELEDLSGYGGPVVPIVFLHDGPPAPASERKKMDKVSEHPEDDESFSLKELSNSLPVNGRRHSQTAPPMRSKPSNTRSTLQV